MGQAPVDQPGDETLNDVSERLELLIKLLKFSSLVSRPMQDNVASPNQIGLNELRVMMGLGGMGEAASHELAEIMAMHPMNVSRAASAMRANDWLEERRDPDNRRRKPLRLTASGWSAYRHLLPDVEGVANLLMAGIDENELTVLARLVDQMLTQLDQYQGSARSRVSLEGEG